MDEKGRVNMEGQNNSGTITGLIDLAKGYNLDNNFLGDVVNLFYQHLMTAVSCAKAEAKVEAIRRLCEYKSVHDPYGMGLDLHTVAAILGFILPEEGKGSGTANEVLFNNETIFVGEVNRRPMEVYTEANKDNLIYRPETDKPENPEVKE